MHKLIATLTGLYSREEGATLTEYVMLAVLIAVTAVAAITLLGQAVIPLLVVEALN